MMQNEISVKSNENKYNSYLSFDDSWTGTTLDRFSPAWMARTKQEMTAVLEAAVNDMTSIRVGGRDVAVPIQLCRVWGYLCDDERKAFMRYLVHARPVQAPPLTEAAVDLIQEAVERKRVAVTGRKIAKIVRKEYVRRCYDHGPYRDLNEPIEEQWELVRNPTLLARLRARISGLFYDAPKECIEMQQVEPEMEDARGEHETSVRASNVVLGETQSESVGGEVVHTPDYYINLSSSEQKPSYSNLTDRFNYCTTIEWNKSQQRDVTLLSYRLPRAALATQQDPCMAPPFVPFTIHRYARMGMQIKIQMNSNKFQVGQLQCSWQYLERYTFNPLNTVFERAQLPHCLISAGAGNEATLDIPYKYYRPYMHTKTRDNFVDPLDLGTLTIKVLSPLAVTDGGPSTANVSVFVRFLDASFTGMIDANIDKPSFTEVQPEMEAVVQQMGMMALNSAIDYAFGDKNCDNPPELAAPKFFVPAAGHTWSIGNGESHPVNMLRLSAVKGCGRRGDPEVNELDMRYPCSVWGMLIPFAWNSKLSSSNTVGKMLWYTSVQPMCDKTRMYNYLSSTTNALKQYVMPPVGVVSSMFQFWRGSLEYRFDIIASQFHSGRLLVAYIPGVDDPSKVTLAQARNSAHMVFSLQEATSFTFVVPYISDKPWWGRRYAGPQRKSEFVAPSSLVVFVLNPLIIMDKVVPSVEIIPYVRAGEDFELAIPVQPAVGISDDPVNYLKDSTKLRALPGYAPFYVGKCSIGADLNLFRYGTVALHYAQFSQISGLAKPDLDQIYIWVLESAKDAPKVQVRGATTKNAAIYAMPLVYQGYTYAMAFTDVKKAIAASVSWRTNGDTTKLLQYDTTWSENDATYGSATAVYVPKLYSISKGTVMEGITILLEDAIRVEPEMEERRIATNALQPTSSLPSTGAGYSNFGEKFVSLKDLLRRYQLYWEGIVTPASDGVLNRAIIQLPLSPSGLELDITNPNQLWNVLREGALGIVSSGYRYFRGGMRLRVVFPAGLDANVWVQHHPDKPADQGLVARTGAAIKQADAFRNHQYGFYVQSLRVNNVVEISIPFYQPGVYGVLRGLNSYGLTSDLIDYISLGDIVIGLEGVTSFPASIPVAAYAALEDDMSFNVFQGFPPIVFCEDTIESLASPPVHVEPEMMGAAKVLGLTALMGVASYVGMKSAVGTAVVRAERMALDCVDGVMEKHVQPIVQQLRDDVGAAAETLTEDVKDTAATIAFTTALGNLMHIAANPTPKTVAIAVVNCLVTVCCSAWEMASRFYSVVEDFFVKYWSKFSGQADRVVVEPEGFEGMYDESAATSMLFTLACAMLGVGASVIKPGGYFNLMKNISATVQLPVNIMRFLQNCGETLTYFLKWLCMKDEATIRAQVVLDEDLPDIKLWFKEAQYLLDPRNRSRLECDRLMNNRVYDACTTGSLLVANGLSDSLPGGKVLWDTYKELCKVRTRLVDIGKHPDVRFEAFSVWVNGGAGIGKSTFATNLAAAMLNEIQYKTNGAACYYLQPGAKWWNGYTDQPVIVRDDAYQITTGPSFEEELASHFAICSCSVLNPPKAAVEEKHLRANPLIYLMLANVAFPAVSTTVAEEEAIYRRRKCMIEARIKPEVKTAWLEANPGKSFTDASQLPSATTKDFGHVEFAIYDSPADKNRTHRDEWVSFAAIKKHMVKAFVDHYTEEQKKFRQRVMDMYMMCPTTGESVYTELPELAHSISLKDQIEKIRARAEEHLASLEDPELQRMPYWQHLKAGVLSYARKFVPEAPRPQCVDPDAAGYIDADRVQSVWCGVLRRMRLPAEANALIQNARWTDPMSLVMFSLDPSREMAFADFDLKIQENDYTVCFPLFMPKEQFTKIKFMDDSEVKLNAWLRLRKFNEDMCTNVSFESWADERVSDEERVRRYLVAVLAYAGSVKLFDAIAFWSDLKRRVMNDDCDTSFLLRKIHEAEMEPGCENYACECARFWGSVLSEKADTVKYSRTRDRFYYTDCIGLSMSVPRICPHTRSVTNCAVFRRLSCFWFEKTLERRGEQGSRESTSAAHQAMFEDAVTVMSHWSRIKLKARKWYDEVLSPFLAKIVRFLVEHMPLILTWTIGATLSIGLHYAMGSLTTDQILDGAFEGSKNYYKWDAPKANAKQSAPHSVPTFQNAPATRVSMIHKLTNNTIFFEGTWVTADGIRSVQQCRCFSPFGRRVIMLKHYVEEYAQAMRDPANTNFRLRAVYNVGGKQSSAWIEPAVLFDTAIEAGPGSNFLLVELPRHFPQFKTLLHLFATKAHHSNMGATCDLFPVTELATYDLPISIKKNYVVTGDSHISDITMGRVYTYYRHGKGLCGSLLVCPSVNAGLGGIVGMHVAGSVSSGEGVAEPLYREMFDKAYAARGYSESEILPMNLDPVPEEKKQKLDSNLMLYGTVPRGFAHHESGKTKIRPSLIQNAVYSVRTEPNPLRPGDPRQPPGSDPLYDGCNKHGSGNVIDFSVEDVRVVVEAEKQCQRLTTLPVRAEIKPMTLQQAVCGDPDIPYCEPLNWKSSEGFPLRVSRPKSAKDKRWLFDLEETERGFKMRGIHDSLAEQMRMRDLCFKRNVKPITVYEDCTKDYRLTPEKCKIPGKTRIFSIAPVQCTLDCKMYLGDICCAIKKSRIVNGIAIGINPDSLEWTQLVHYLHEVGTNIVTLDYSNYGPCLLSQLVEGSIEIFLDWLEYNGASKEHLDRAEWIMRNDIMNPIHLCEDIIYQVHNGISSGSPITTEKNSVPNKLYIRLAWCDIFREDPILRLMSAFEENVRDVVYGDDVIMSVSDLVIDRFNAVTIAASLRKHGIIVTNASKTKEVTTHGTIYDATFLKRGFAHHPSRKGVWLAPLDVASVEECVNWVHDCNDLKGATIQACEASLDLAFGLGPVWYEEHRVKLVKAVQKIGAALRTKNWKERDAEIFGDSCVDRIDLTPKIDWYMNNDYYNRC
ncbi:hypothetical protein [Hubei tetragnatha maxillosa virus 2]|uniref:hypothetical protein n=1 Tax=Hubei tetragnatha maxillosa virus 2 TaxID=1923244 RepID=UPI00090B55C3|nr:hypothetical protein [Hubei tetragnatha maxillosa virus 2]APG77970.1 hypothetical protein [Hubei tetragnatha maxillosa virus 2]